MENSKKLIQAHWILENNVNFGIIDNHSSASLNPIWENFVVGSR